MANIRIDREEVFEIKMPTILNIGDPVYFDKYGEDFKYVYSRKFRGKKDWIGKLIITESTNLDLSKEFGREISSVDFKAIFAPTEEHIKTYEDNCYYKRQKVITIDIGVDTASYIVSTKDRCIKIKTGSDGFMGYVNEFYTNSKLEGVNIFLTGLDVNSFERFRDEVKYVFGL